MDASKPRKRAPGAGRKPQGARKKVKTSVALDADLLERTDAEATRRGVTRNALIETAIEREISDARRDDTPAGA